MDEDALGGGEEEEAAMKEWVALSCPVHGHGCHPCFC